jgi:Lar family restriction alleviation protein
MTPELKPCPFCGSDDVYVHCPGDYGHVACKECDADGPYVMADNLQVIIDAWNTRAGEEK